MLLIRTLNMRMPHKVQNNLPLKVFIKHWALKLRKEENKSSFSIQIIEFAEMKAV